jgi:hypothetical protein
MVFFAAASDPRWEVTPVFSAACSQAKSRRTEEKLSTVDCEL